MRRLFLTCVLSLIFFLRCNKDKNPTSPDEKSSDDIMPFKVGNFWNYVDSSFTDDGTFLFEDYSKLGISGKETINFNGNR